MANEIRITVKATARGLRGEVQREAAAAGAGQEIRIPVTADTSQLRDSMRSLGDSSSSFGRLPWWSRLAIPAAPLAVAAASELAGALGMIPAAAGLAGTALTAVGVGASGVTDVFQEHKRATEATIGATARMAYAQLAAADAVTSARDDQKRALQDIARAETDSARAVETARKQVTAAVTAHGRAKRDADAANAAAVRAAERAEHSYGDAQRSVLRAQEDLTEARRDAARALEDLTDRVLDDEAAQESAIRRLERAQLDLAEAYALSDAAKRAGLTYDPDYDADEVRRAADAYSDAERAVQRTTRQLERSREEQAKAAAEGVEGSERVSDARARLADAERNVTDARDAAAEAARRVTDTEQEGAARVADALLAVEEARAGVDRAREDGERRVADAQDRSQDATRALTGAIAAQAAQAEGAAGSMAAFNAMLAQLHPNAQDAVHAILDLGDEWDALKQRVQGRLFAGLGAEIREVGEADLPILSQGLEHMAGAVNKALREFTDFLTLPDSMRDWEQIFENFGLAGENASKLIDPLLSILTDIVAVGSELLPGVVDDLAGGAESLAEFVSRARESGQLREWMQDGIDAVSDLITIGRDLLVIFNEFREMDGFTGDSVLDDIRNLIGLARWLMETFDKVELEWKDLAGAADWVWDKLYRGWNAFIEFFGDVGREISHVGSWMWDGIVEGAKRMLNAVIGPINGAINGVNLLIRGMNLINPFSDIPYVPNLVRFAAGGVSPGGLALVGEQGPELVRLPGGSQVIPAGQTREMLPGATGGDHGRVVVEIQLSGLSEDELDRIRRKITVRGGDVQTVLGSSRRSVA